MDLLPFSHPVYFFILALVALPVGVMAANLDGDLVGVVAAAVVIGVLLVVLIGFMAYCCFRRMETERTTIIPRKDSSTVVSVTPRWLPNANPTYPVFNVGEPMVYTPSSVYYLGDYRPRYIGMEHLQFMQPYMIGDRRHVREHHEDEEDHDHSQTTTHKMVEAAQPNGNVVHDFSASSVNYKVIRKQHQHMKMPDWLKKSYEESKVTMDVDDEGSRTSSVRMAITSSKREDANQDPSVQATARAQVSPRNSTLDTRDLFHFSDDFTIIDYVDPDRGPPRPRSPGKTRQMTSSAVTSNVNAATATAYTTTTTTYLVKKNIVNTSNASSDGQYVPPASTSTPRAPMTSVEGEVEIVQTTDIDSHRQRKPGEGSVAYLPAFDKDVRL